MTTQKTLKRRVRARAAKTGESYSAARAQVLRKAEEPAPEPDTMELAGMTVAAFVRGSGKPIGEWLEILDGWGATERKHTEIARWVVQEYGIGGWWAQSVTVAYERARGMRQLHQDPSGYSVSASKTIKAAPERVSDAFTDAVSPRPMASRTRRSPCGRSNRGRSARFSWDDPPSLVGFMLYEKGEGKTQIGIGHEKLPDSPTAERIKLMWRDRLGALKELLET